MKNRLNALMFCFLLLGVKGLYGTDSTIFDLSKPSSDISTRYSEEEVKGKKVISVQAFPDKIYYVFLALDVSTMINLPYPVRWNPDTKSADIINPAGDIIKIDHKSGDNYFTIKPSRAGFTGHRSNIHIVCENGFTVLINIIIGPAEQANQLITFADGTKEFQKTKAYFDQELKTANSKTQDRENTLSELFFKEILKFPIGESIKAGQDSYTLSNLVSVPGFLYYNLELSFSPEQLKSKKIVLELQPFSNFILSEQKLDKHVFEPDSIVIYNDPGSNKATLVFKTESIGELFYSKLKIGDTVSFEDKINLRMNTIAYNIFDPMF